MAASGVSAVNKVSEVTAFEVSEFMWRKVTELQPFSDLIIKMWLFWYTSSVIRQKGESRNECFKKTKHAKFSDKRTILTPWYAHVRLRIKG